MLRSDWDAKKSKIRNSSSARIFQEDNCKAIKRNIENVQIDKNVFLLPSQTHTFQWRLELLKCCDILCGFLLFRSVPPNRREKKVYRQKPQQDNTFIFFLLLCCLFYDYYHYFTGDEFSSVSQMNGKRPQHQNHSAQS